MYSVWCTVYANGVQFVGCIANSRRGRRATSDGRLKLISHSRIRAVYGVSSLLIRRSCRFPEHSRLNVRDGKAGDLWIRDTLETPVRIPSRKRENPEIP